MDLQDTRMQCLRMAAEMRGNVDAVIAAAQRMYEFVKGAEPAAPAETVATPPEPVAAAEPKAKNAAAPVAASAEEAAAPEPLIADPIAACGTALVMPQDGNLAEALPPAEAAAAEAPAEAAAEEALAEAKAEEAPAEVAAAEAPAEEAAEEAPAEAKAEEAPAEVEAAEAPVEVAAKVEVPAVDETFVVPPPPANLGEQPAQRA